MRAAGWSLVNRNLIIAEEVLLLLSLSLLLLERENEYRKRETDEREEDEETGDRVGRSSGRGRGVRRPVGGRESKRKRNDEEHRTSLGRSNGERGEGCCGWTVNSACAGKSAMSSFGDAILAAMRGN